MNHKWIILTGFLKNNYIFLFLYSCLLVCFCKNKSQLKYCKEPVTTRNRRLFQPLSLSMYNRVGHGQRLPISIKIISTRETRQRIYINLRKLKNTYVLTFQAPTSQNGQTHSNNSSATIVWVYLTILWGSRLKG